MYSNIDILTFQILLASVAWTWAAEQNGNSDLSEIRHQGTPAGHARGPRGDTMPLHEIPKPQLNAQEGKNSRPEDFSPIESIAVSKDLPAFKGDVGPGIEGTSLRPTTATTAPYSQHYLYLENQHASFKCSPGQFITRLHVSYAAGMSHSTSFTYKFIFRRHPIVLVHYGSTTVNQYSCHGLKHCVGHQACLFQVTSGLCLHDPAPGRRKILSVRVACETVSGYHGPSRTLPLLQQLSNTTGVLTVKQKTGKPVVVESSVTGTEVFGISCPKQQSDNFRSRFIGHCRNPPPPAVQVAEDLWPLIGRAPSYSCRSEILDVYCAYQYNASGGCLPRFFLTPNSVAAADSKLLEKVQHVVKRSAESQDDDGDGDAKAAVPAWRFNSFPEPRPRRDSDALQYTSSNIQDLNPVRIAFAILVHDHATVALQLLKSIYDPSHFYVLHVDARADTVRQSLIQLVIENFVRQGRHNVRVLAKKRCVITSAGSYGVVRAQLTAIEELLSMGTWSFAVVALGGGDMVLRSVDDLAATLASYRGMNFVRLSRMWATRPHKSDSYAWHQCGGGDFVYNVTKRSHPQYSIASTNHASVISREAAEYLVAGPRNHEFSLLQFTLETSLHAGDVYIPTILASSHLWNTVLTSHLMVSKPSPLLSAEESMSCDVLKEVDSCIQESGIYDESDLPYLRRNSFQSIFARRFADDADNPVRSLLSQWARVALSRHVQRSYGSDSAARLMAAKIARKLLGEGWKSQANVSSIGIIRILPRLVPSQQCCRSRLLMQTGLLGEMLYWLEFSVRMKGGGHRRRLRGTVSQLPRTQCFPGGDVSAMLMGTRFLVRDGRHSPWTTLVPAAWDPAGDTSFWIMVVLNTDDSSRPEGCTLENYKLRQEEWRARFPHLPQTVGAGKWLSFAGINTSLHFVLQLVDPKGEVRCVKSFSVTWKRSETSSWQSWRFFSCGDLEPGLWTARLVPKDSEDPHGPVYTSHVFLSNANLRNTAISNSMSGYWTVDHAVFVNSSSNGRKSSFADSFAVPSVAAGAQDGDFKSRKLHLLKGGGKRKTGKSRLKVKAKAGNRKSHISKSRPGDKTLTAFERRFHAVAGLIVRIIIVAAILYFILTQVLRVKIRGSFSTVQATLLISVVLVLVQTLLYRSLPS